MDFGKIWIGPDDETPINIHEICYKSDEQWRELQRRRNFLNTIHNMANNARDEGYHASAQILRDAAFVIKHKLISENSITSAVNYHRAPPQNNIEEDIDERKYEDIPCEICPQPVTIDGEPLEALKLLVKEVGRAIKQRR